MGETVLNPWTKIRRMSFRAETDIKARTADLLIFSTGGIFWITHKVFKSACLFDVTDYPFDQHECHLWFQSLSYQSKKLNPNAMIFDLDTYLSDFKVSNHVDIWISLVLFCEKEVFVSKNLFWNWLWIFICLTFLKSLFLFLLGNISIILQFFFLNELIFQQKLSF